jgi:hypothetical protein
MTVFDETNLKVIGTASVTVQDEVITYPQALLSDARNLIDSGQFSMGVVVSHIACELATERSLFAAFASKGIQYLEEWILDSLNGYNLANKRVRRLFTALTGNEIQEQPFWQNFTESVERRNQIVHRGVKVGQAEAEDSLKVATDFLAYLRK